MKLLAIEADQNAYLILADDLLTEGETRLLYDHEGVFWFKPHLDKGWYLIAHKNFTVVKNYIHAEYQSVMINMAAKWVVPEEVGKSISVKNLSTFTNPDWAGETFKRLLSKKETGN